MSEITISLETPDFSGLLETPGVREVPVAFKVVTGLQLPDSSPLLFKHYIPEVSGVSYDTITLPEAKAQRVANFALAHFVHGARDFDCRSFMGYVMGWDDAVTVGKPRNYFGGRVDPEDTKPGLPYMIPRDPQAGVGVAHAFFGHDQPGKSLSVISYESPLVIADNAQLMQAFGGAALLEITHSEEA